MDEAREEEGVGVGVGDRICALMEMRSAARCNKTRVRVMIDVGRGRKAVRRGEQICER